MANKRYVQFTSTPHDKAILLDCSFTVDPNNANGFGVSGLYGAYIGSVFMHTTASPGSVLNGQVNPNPESGIIVVTLQENYAKLLDIHTSLISSVSGQAVVQISGGLTLAHPYVIDSVGSSTAANWQAVGLSPYITPASGVSFIASTASAGSGSGSVQVAVTSGIDHIEVIGVSNLANNEASNSNQYGIGMQIILACYSGEAWLPQ